MVKFSTMPDADLVAALSQAVRAVPVELVVLAALTVVAWTLARFVVAGRAPW